MKIAFTTLACPDWPFQRIVDTARALAYDGIELRFIAGSIDILNAPELAPRGRETTLGMLRDAQLEICCLDSSVRLIDADPAKREAYLLDGADFIKRAQAFGVPFVRVFGDTFVPGVEHRQAMDWAVAGLKWLGQRAAGTGVTVLLESHGDFSRSDLLREVMERVDSPGAGILYDAHHPWRFHGEAPADTVRKLAPWIRHTHWKDSSRQAADLKSAALTPQTADHKPGAAPGVNSATAFDYVLLGEGQFPLVEALVALKTIQYDGWYAFEWEKKWHPEIPDPEVALPHFMATFKRSRDAVYGA